MCNLAQSLRRNVLVLRAFKSYKSARDLWESHGITRA